VGLAHDARSWGRFKGDHFDHSGRLTGKFHEHGRRVIIRSPSYGNEHSGHKSATVCRCTELSCCDGGD
jgi:hypothetical protein